MPCFAIGRINKPVGCISRDPEPVSIYWPTIGTVDNIGLCPIYTISPCFLVAALYLVGSLAAKSYRFAKTRSHLQSVALVRDFRDFQGRLL